MTLRIAEVGYFAEGQGVFGRVGQNDVYFSAICEAALLEGVAILPADRRRIALDLTIDRVLDADPILENGPPAPGTACLKPTLTLFRK